MLVLIHSPVPASVGVIVSGWGRLARSRVPTKRHDRPVERDRDGAVHAHVVRTVGGLGVRHFQEAGGGEFEGDRLLKPQPRGAGRALGQRNPILGPALERLGRREAQRVALHLHLARRLRLDGERRAGRGRVHRLVEGHDHGRGQDRLLAAVGRHADHGWGQWRTRRRGERGSGRRHRLAGGRNRRWLAGACALGAVTGEDEGVGDGPAEQALRMIRTSTANRFRE